MRSRSIAFGVLVGGLAGYWLGVARDRGVQLDLEPGGARGTAAGAPVEVAGLPEAADLPDGALPAAQREEVAPKGPSIIELARDMSLQALEGPHRRETLRRLVRPMAREHFKRPKDLVACPQLNPDAVQPTEQEMEELEQLVESAREAVVDVLVERSELHDRILEEKLAGEDVVELEPGVASMPIKSEDALVSGVVHQRGKGLAYRIRRGDDAEFDATYEVEDAIGRQLDSDLKEFFERLASR